MLPTIWPSLDIVYAMVTLSDLEAVAPVQSKTTVPSKISAPGYLEERIGQSKFGLGTDGQV